MCNVGDDEGGYQPFSMQYTPFCVSELINNKQYFVSDQITCEHYYL